MGHTVAERSWKDADFVCFPVFSVAVMQKCCDACGDGEYYSGRVVQFKECCCPRGINCRSPEVDGTWVAEWSWKDADFVYSLYLAWRLWKSVVTLAEAGNTISGRVFSVRGCECP
jgi:hypothetical protein